MTGDLADLSLLERCPETERTEIAAALESLWLEPGETLFREGDAADALFWLVEGCIALLREGTGEAAERGPGSALGALSLVIEGPRELSAETRSRCRVLRLSRESFAAIVERAPRAACRLLEGILREQAECERSAGRALLRVQLDRSGSSD